MSNEANSKHSAPGNALDPPSLMSQRHHLGSCLRRLSRHQPPTGKDSAAGWALLALLLPALASSAPVFTSSATGGANPLNAINDPYDGIIVGDFDSDGHVDVLAFDDNTRTSYTFYRNDGSAHFSAVTGSANPFDGIAVSDIFYSSLTTYVADFDNDGDLDIWDYQ